MSETEESREIRCFMCNWEEERTTFLSDIKALQYANDNLQQYILRLQDEILSLKGELDEAPAIVRCMNCRFLILNKETFHRCWRFGHDVYGLLSFCSWGERKGGEDDA